MKQYRVIIAVLLSVVSFSRNAAADDYAGKKASLWRKNSIFSSIYHDPKARGINDIVIIKISENSTASNTAELSTSRKTSTSMGIDSFLGLEKDYAGTITPSFDPTSMFGGSTNNSHQGTGTSSRETTLSTYISARVTDLMPNGNMIIEAKKEVMVNKEKQTVILRGIIRPRDIAYNNIIESNKIADMQVMFSGKGPVSEQTRRGWLSWILNLIWPF